MQVNLEQKWRNLLKDEFNKPYFIELIKNIENEYKIAECYPNYNQLFNAFNLCSLDKLKVVIIGQDPYHGEGQANGLCFSVNEGIPFPPSLKNIFKELKNDVDKEIPIHGDLSYLAKQGVLLLNATLTVRKSQAGSHQKLGWETFTNMVIKKISENKKDIVFLLWGGFAKKKVTFIDKNKHHILTSGHPSPLSANRGYWFGNEHFSKTNTFLNKIIQSQIDW